MADIDLSDRYRRELRIRHTGKATKKDRKAALPAAFVGAYLAYTREVPRDRCHVQLHRLPRVLFAELRVRTGMTKELTLTTLRHTHVVRAYRRGEDPDVIFDRIGLAPASRKEADELYTRLAAQGI